MSKAHMLIGTTKSYLQENKNLDNLIGIIYNELSLICYRVNELTI